MALQSSVGITVGVSATLPTSHDDDGTTGFPSLTYTSCGKLSAPPAMTGTFDITTFDDLSTGEETKMVDMLRAGSGELTFGYDVADTGQAALVVAADATADATKKVALAFTLANGDVYYRLAIITSYAPTASAGSVLMANVATEFYKSHVKVAA
jgi:hypothetical protein